MTYPNNPQFLAWWNLGAHARQSRLEVGWPGYDPTTDSALQDLNTTVRPNYSPTTSAPTGTGSRWQSGPTPFDADDTD